MKASYLLLLLPCLSIAAQQPVSDKREILKQVYSDCRKKLDVMTCVDKATTFGKQIGYDRKNAGEDGGDLEMSLFFIVQDDLSSTTSTAVKKK